MGIFDIFGTGAQTAAAGAQAAGTGQGYGALTSLYDLAQGAVGGAYTPGTTPATNALNTNYGIGLNNFASLYGQGAGAIQQGYGGGLASLANRYGQGSTALQQKYAQGLVPYLTNYEQSLQGINQLGNLLGLGGPSGNAAALQTLENTPGYKFALNQGDAAINAQAAATGKLASGNTLIDLSKFNQGLASTTYENAVQNLVPYLAYSNAAAGGVLGGYSGLGQGLADLYQNWGNQAAGLNVGSGTGLAGLYAGQGNIYNQSLQNLGGNLANIYSGIGTQQGNLFQSQGNAAYGAYGSIGNAMANANLAGLGASANLWGLGLGGLGLGAGLYALSDARAKDDVEEVGKLHSGEPIMRFRYKGDPRTQIGLIAQHVERVTPDAVHEVHDNVRPMKYVDYKRATDMAAGLAKFLKKAA